MKAQSKLKSWEFQASGFYKVCYLRDLKNPVDLSMSTVYFKIKLAKILDKYSKLERLFLALNFFEDYLKTIK